MTTISRSYLSTGSARGIDVRCSARLPRIGGDEGRCQLFAGHDGPHAVMFAHCGKRLVRTWKSGNPAAARDGEFTMHRPWMYGYPVPAWFESEVEQHR